MISQFYNLGEDEIDDAIASLNNMLIIKRIEKSLGCMPYLKKLYHRGFIPTRRDFDAEGYNGVQESPVGILMLDAIFTEECYSIDEVITDIEEAERTKEELELMYYEFKIEPKDKLTYEEIENLGIYPKILSLSSGNISKALKIAEVAKFQHESNEIINKIEYLANLCSVYAGDVPESSLIDLNSYKIDLLLNDVSMYEIEVSTINLLELEEYCKDVVGRYSSWID